MRPIVILNRSAGTLCGETGDPADCSAETVIRGVLAEYDIEPDVRIVEGAQVLDAAREAAGGHWDTVIAGGGDGTLNAIASALVGTGKAFAVLPLGTLNHLARELQTPMRLKAAVHALVGGRTDMLSIGAVNDRYFLSFSGMGLYARVIKHRDAQRKTLGRRKGPAMAIAFAKMLYRFPVWRLRIDSGDQRYAYVTPVLYVAISNYQQHLFGLDDAPDLPPRRQLTLLVARAHRRWGIFALALRAALGKVSREKDYKAIRGQQFTIESRLKSLRVALDGEIVDLTPPLHFRVLHDGLTLLRPAVPGVSKDSEQAPQLHG